ncbi:MULTISPECIES: glycosyltransferase family 2 protein [Micrococcaceae]|uniref:glycosyltransferase family 2 protein n=1 Tax=unclassified Kocuria TaxID=2649579 RepID=UPI0010132596|nr:MULTISPECIES: glycosyltransferase family 2 protein [unclassified Kocuria]
MAPRTSVILPVYNTASSVIRSIRSVTAQTDPDFELVVINDASPDDADRVIRQHLASIDDPRVRYVVNDHNLGLAGSRNRGMREARGEWVAFLDSDDVYHPEFLEKMHAQTTASTDVVVCCHDVLYPDGTHRYRVRGTTGIFTGRQAMINLMRDQLTPYAWDKIFRVSSLEDLEFPLLNRVEDSGFSIAAYQRAREVVYIQDSLHLYSVNPKSITWGSVPPISESYRFMEFLKERTQAHRGSYREKNALAAAWILTFLNSAQAALRLNPPALESHVAACQNAMNCTLLLRCLMTRPVYALAGALLKGSPPLYGVLYKEFVKRQYGL